MHPSHVTPVCRTVTVGCVRKSKQQIYDSKQCSVWTKNLAYQLQNEIEMGVWVVVVWLSLLYANILILYFVVIIKKDSKQKLSNQLYWKQALRLVRVRHCAACIVTHLHSECGQQLCYLVYKLRPAVQAACAVRHLHRRGPAWPLPSVHEDTRPYVRYQQCSIGLVCL